MKAEGDMGLCLLIGMLALLQRYPHMIPREAPDQNTNQQSLGCNYTLSYVIDFIVSLLQVVSGCLDTSFGSHSNFSSVLMCT